MKEFLKPFLDHLRYNRNLSPHTVRAYESDITQFLAFVAADRQQLDGKVSVRDLTPGVVRAYLAELRDPLAMVARRAEHLGQTDSEKSS